MQRAPFGTWPLFLAAVAACGDGATNDRDVFMGPPISLSHAQIISAYPASRATDGTWERACAGDPDPVAGLLLNVSFVSTTRERDERDLAIRPGDVIDTRVVGGSADDDIDLTGTGKIGFAFDCLDPVPHPRPAGDACQGVRDPTISRDGGGWVGNTADRTIGHDVILLIDQSGSIGGLVDVAGGHLERAEGTFDLPPEPSDVATDPYSLRLAAARTFAEALNDRDALGVIGFGEQLGAGAGLEIPCTDALGLPAAQGLATCFGTDRERWVAETGIDSLRGDTGGRSNLWEAVAVAYDFLAARPDPARSRHIVVVTDGPDTCARGEALTTCGDACSDVSAADIVARIAADRADPDGPRVHVSFVQLEALGYPGRDPHQVDIACQSGGHYRFIDNNGFAREQLAPFQESLDQALLELRSSLAGHWAFAASVPAYTSDEVAPTGTPPGTLYALSGRLVVYPASHLVADNDEFRFGVGEGVGADNAPTWDRRPTVLDPCTSQDACLGVASGGLCCSGVCSDVCAVCPER